MNILSFPKEYTGIVTSSGKSGSSKEHLRCSPLFFGYLLLLVIGFLLSAGFDGQAKTGAPKAAALYKDMAVILNYHDVRDADGVATISPKSFKAHMIYLRDKGYNVIEIGRLTAFLEGKASIPANAVCITFDDGYQTYAENAFPILQEFKYPSAHFVVVADTERKPLPGKLAHMSWPTLNRLADSGLVQIGSHTFDSHGLLPGSTESRPITALTNRITGKGGKKETPSAYDKRIADDLSKARTKLRKGLGRPVDILAYPYGETSEEVIKIARACGYRFMFTTETGAVGRQTDHSRIPRINAGSPWVTVQYLDAKIREAVKRYQGTKR